MTRIITLLNEKNHYLEKFYSLNEVELANFAQGQFDNLQHFYQTRERILDVLKYVDAQIEKAHGEMGPNATLTENDRTQVREALSIKDEYVTRIIEQDIQVLTCIETAKNSIIKELQEVRRNRKGISGYKVNTFTNRLNEEA
ncbi:flagellar protein FliT [Bdellovibrio svalbardensis]|uniref:Flagellar protein FliT n=1 Tax=Bdellovibrio svalbardensis TaxID=2972972 RepID=A0ABT6DM06_9BACT|nr:flagellar protein FliT [Bdellovibrio svalbardensis]MDG0816949.1 flagellar protein FliT [Bdellovibrio svalbardensis]